MKTSLKSRIVAVVAATGLLAIAAPMAAPASAADACALGSTCQGVLTGPLGDTPFQITMPPKFNGTVLLYSHGYRIANPVPAAIGTVLGMDKAPYYSATEVPGLAASFGTNTAYVGNNMAQVAPTAESAASLLGQGYALAGAGYSRQGWASAEGVEAGELLIRHINSGAVKGTKQIMVWGDSLGGLISAALADRNPGKVAGVLPSCGVLAGPEQAFDTAMTVLYTWKTLIAPNLKVANYTPGTAGYIEALTDLGTVFSILGKVSTGELTVSPAGYPIAQANLLAGLMGGLPTKSSTYDGITVNPAFGTLGTAGALAGGFSPASAGASSAAAMLQNVGAAAALGIMGRFDMEMRARAIASIPNTDSANFNSNVPVVYSKLLSPEQRGEFEGVFTAAGPGVLNAMLGALDASVGSDTARFPANPAAVAAVRALPAPSGAYKVPTVMITTEYDPVVPAGNTQAYYDRLAASHKKTSPKSLFKVAEYYTMPPLDGWTQFQAGAKGPDAALSAAALGGSGVGHCTYTNDQMVGAVKTLAAVVKAKTATALNAAKKIGYKAAGVNRDRDYLPEPLKRPLLTAAG